MAKKFQSNGTNFDSKVLPLLFKEIIFVLLPDFFDNVRRSQNNILIKSTQNSSQILLF